MNAGTPPAVLVTGGTGTLGRWVVRRLQERGRTVRILSRHPRDTAAAPRADDTPPQWAQGDLATGDGLEAAVTAADTLVHCATSGGRRDVQDTQRLIDAVHRTGGTPHLVYISIVGVDRIPLFYYRAKLLTEETVRTSGLPWTILRTTQFHALIARMTTLQHRLPLTLVPSRTRFQPVDEAEVADRLTHLALGEPAGRAEDMGGPQVLSARELARLTLHAQGRHRPLLPVHLPGATARGYRAGHHLAPGHATGRRTYAQYLDDTRVTETSDRAAR